MPSLLSRLLAESVRQWCVPARVSVDGQGAVRVTCLGREIIVERAASGSPFRWMVTVEGVCGSRRRPALSVVSGLSPLERYAWVADALDTLPGSGIVYVLTVPEADRLAGFLHSCGPQVLAYTGHI